MNWVDELDLPYATIVGNYGSSLGTGVNPLPGQDLRKLTGVVTFTPSIKYVKISGKLIEVKPVKAKLVNGVVTGLDGKDIHLLATDTLVDNVQGWYWKATFTTRGSRIPLVKFYTPEGTTVDLVQQTKGVSGGSVEFVEGPQGPKGDPGVSIIDWEQVGYGSAALKLSDGRTSSPIALPPGPPPTVSWNDDVLVVEGQPSPHLTGKGISTLSAPTDDGTATVTWTDGSTTQVKFPTIRLTDEERELVGKVVASVDSLNTAVDSAKISSTSAKASEDNARASKDAAKTSEQNASTSATNASASATSASTSATNASVSATAAKASEDHVVTVAGEVDTNKQWVEAVSTQVEGWANSAESSSTSASASATSASNSATSASTSASTATTEAQKAADEHKALTDAIAAGTYKGDKGDTGPSNTLTVAGTFSRPYGQAPSVSIFGTSPNQSMYFYIPQGAPGAKGETGGPGAVATASDYLVVAPGRPDQPSTTGGAITGNEPIGCEFRSSTGGTDACGAIRWQKTATNTWIVVSGDTGWRVLTPATNPTTSSVRIRRINDNITILGTNMGTAPLRIIYTPTGWQPNGDAWTIRQGAPVYRHGAVVGQVCFGGNTNSAYSGADSLWFTGSGVADIGSAFSLSYQAQPQTQTPWPTILPGISA